MCTLTLTIVTIDFTTGARKARKLAKHKGKKETEVHEKFSEEILQAAVLTVTSPASAAATICLTSALITGSTESY